MIHNITLGLIVRESRAMLARTLPAYAGVFANKVAIDFGSKDGSPDFLRSLNFKVLDQCWNDNYADARNTLIKWTHNLMTPSWLLMLDSDEAMLPADLVQLSHAVESLDRDAYCFDRYNFVGNLNHLADTFPDAQTRLIRLGSDVHYVNAVHECSAGSKPRGHLTYPIYHYGLCRPQAEIFEKWRRYAVLQNQPYPAEMPAGFGDYKALGEQVPWTKTHPLQHEVPKDQVVEVPVPEVPNSPVPNSQTLDGQPDFEAPDRITVDEKLRARFAAYKEQVGDNWGPLHIVLADGNVEDKHIQFCQDHALEQQDVEGAKLADVLLACSRTQRLKLYNSL